MTNLSITYIELNDLKPYKNNPKTHPEKQVEKIANSIKRFGFKIPCIVDKNNVLIAGHGRVLAARKLGMSSVPCVVVDDLTDAEINALRIADNKLVESDWDEDLLSKELELLEKDLKELTGFSDKELNKLLETKEVVEDEVPEVPKETVIKKGDLIELGTYIEKDGKTMNVEVIK